GGASGPTGGDYHGPNQMTFTGTWEDTVGARVGVSITVAEEESLPHRPPRAPGGGDCAAGAPAPVPPGSAGTPGPGGRGWGGGGVGGRGAGSGGGCAGALAAPGRGGPG